MIKEKLQWHPAFSAALRIELDANRNDLEFRDEYPLSKKPMQMDILVIKKDRHITIKKNIGHIFRTYNIIEYKPPDDSLSVNDFYKVYGYTCFYQSDTQRIREIDPNEITITFVCGKYPRKLLKHLKRSRGIKINKYDSGIYYLEGDEFPIQLLITTQLSKKHNYWLQHLRNNLRAGKEIQTLIKNYDLKKDSKNHQAVMDLIVRANWNQMKEEQKRMCDALRELFAEELDECRKRGLQEGIEQGLEQGLERGLEQGLERGLEQGLEQGLERGLERGLKQGTAIGNANGEKRKLIQQICKKLAKGKTIPVIADDLEEDISVIKEIYTIAAQFAPTYDCNLVYKKFKL